jgi:hypothetical protein
MRDGFALVEIYLPVISAAARSIKSIAYVQQFQLTHKSAPEIERDEMRPRLSRSQHRIKSHY